VNKKYWVVASMVVIGMETTAPAFASEMVYHPVNPTFGGNPLNGTFLLSTAQAQGEGVKSGPQGPDLSGLTNALSNPIIIDGTGSGSGSGGTNNSGTSNASRSLVP
jgi:curli production assembly/transport component CsgF